MTADPPAKKMPKKRTPPAAAAVAGKPVGRRPGEEIKSKADLIRKVAGIIRSKGHRPRPTDIVKILGDEGVTVSPAQVSMTLKAAGYRPLRTRHAGTTTAARKVGRARRSQELSIDDLLAAKSVSGAFGGTDKAIAALRALKRLEG